jgi:hypothetical protein
LWEHPEKVTPERARILKAFVDGGHVSAKNPMSSNDFKELGGSAIRVYLCNAKVGFIERVLPQEDGSGGGFYITQLGRASLSNYQKELHQKEKEKAQAEKEKAAAPKASRKKEAVTA